MQLGLSSAVSAQRWFHVGYKGLEVDTTRLGKILVSSLHCIALSVNDLAEKHKRQARRFTYAECNIGLGGAGFGCNNARRP
jgi:hypothetical protein